jgi:murein L,D-transpeptidase YafK
MRKRPARNPWFRTIFFGGVFLLGASYSARPLRADQNPQPAEPEGSCYAALEYKGMYYGKADYLFPASEARNPRVYVYKSRRRLLVFEGDILIRDYPIALGSAPIGDKRRRGDGCTPEGEFAVCLKNSVSKYNKSLWLNYPGPKHAEEALLSGLLSHREYLSIIGAHKKMQRPPMNTSLGGGICIHGGGAHEDWTEGCVALYNFDMNELFKIVKTGTPVLILP